MTAIAAVSTSPCAPPVAGPAECPQGDGGPSGLPPPLLGGAEPTDVLGMMMAAVERMSSISGEESEKRIRVNQQKLSKAIDDFIDKIAEAMEAARKAAAARKKKKRGLLGKVGSAVGRTCGKVVGSAVDFMKDAAEAPFEIGIAMVKNGGNPVQAFQSALRDQLSELTTNGDVAASVEGFTRGVVQFAADFADFAVAFTLASAKDGLSGNTPSLDALREAGCKVWESLSENILMNEAFWDVVEPLAKAAAVAGALASGGALAPLAVGALMLLEADARTGFLEEVVGADAAPYVRMGLALGTAAVAMGGTGEIATMARYVQAGTTVLGGMANIEQARLSLEEAGRVRDEAHREADLQEILHRVRTLHQIVDELVEALTETSDTRQANQSMFQSLSQTQASVESAMILRA